MALTIKENFRCSVGGKKWAFFTITHDDTATAVSADLLDFDRIEAFGWSLGTIGSAPTAFVTMTLGANGKTIDFSEALNVASITPLWAIGY